MHYQAYLIEGLVRWNAARADAALQPQQPDAGPRLLTFDIGLQHRINALAGEVGLPPFFPTYRPPAEYTGQFERQPQRAPLKVFLTRVLLQFSPHLGLIVSCNIEN